MKRKKGIVQTLIYYSICLVLFTVLSMTVNQPRHFIGLDYMFLFLIALIAFFLILINLISINMNKHKDYNIGALIIHLIFLIGIIFWYLIGYYSQFE
jgi:hypothetical protein